MTDVRTEIVNHIDAALRTSGRRDFLRLAAMGGMGVFLPAVIAGCSDSLSPDPYKHATFKMASTAGPLNAIYAYSQFMFDFYTRVNSSTLHYAGMTAVESYLFDTMTKQKQAHVYALNRLIQTGRIADALLFDFRTIAFVNRESTLSAAMTFEDLGVAMINGLAPTFTNATDLVLASKIASVWARHSAVIRDIQYLNGAIPSRTGMAGDDIVDSATGLDRATDPATFTAAAQPYFLTTLSVG